MYNFTATQSELMLLWPREISRNLRHFFFVATLHTPLSTKIPDFRGSQVGRYAFGETCTRCVVYFLWGLSLWTGGLQGPVLLRYPMGKCEFPTHVLPTLFVMAILSNKGATKVLRLLHLISQHHRSTRSGRSARLKLFFLFSLLSLRQSVLHQCTCYNCQCCWPTYQD